MADTKYAVLRKQADGGWQFVNYATTSGSEAAARQVALEIENGKGDGSGEYVAVPERSFDPIKVAIEIEARAVVAAKVSP